MKEWLEEEKQRSYHKVSSLFPMMEGEEYERLEADIDANGLLEAIWLHTDGSIIDGRNRHRACIKTEIEPRFRTWDGQGSLISLVLSVNLHRRHLSASQRAMVAARVAGMPPWRPSKSVQICTLSQPQAAIALGVSVRSVKYAQQVLDKGVPQLQSAVDQGKTAVDSAAKAAKNFSKEDQGTFARMVSEGTKGNSAIKRINDEKKRESIRQYTEQIEDLPALKKTYNVIYADPPWDYGGHEYKDAEASKHYGVMSLDKICSYLDDVSLLIAGDAVLFLWATNPHLEHALQVIKAWRFEYKTNIVWVKTELKRPGVGFYVRGRHELLMICTRGSFTPLDKNISPPIGSVVRAPIGEHSEKPEAVYGVIERLYPNCTCVELFGRKLRLNWEALGAEL